MHLSFSYKQKTECQKKSYCIKHFFFGSTSSKHTQQSIFSPLRHILHCFHWGAKDFVGLKCCIVLKIIQITVFPGKVTFKKFCFVLLWEYIFKIHLIWENLHTEYIDYIRWNTMVLWYTMVLNVLHIPVSCSTMLLRYIQYKTCIAMLHLPWCHETRMYTWILESI